MVDTQKTCAHCGHIAQKLTRICPECGQPFSTNKVRALAIVEGTAGIGKSTLVNHMVKTYAQDYQSLRTLLHLSQDHTYSPLDPDNIHNPLTAQDNEAYLRRIYDILSFLSQPIGKPTKLACIIETLHITLAFRPGILSRQQILTFDGQLADLGYKLIFIKVSPQTLWERCIWERRNNGFITQYGEKYGNTLDEIYHYYVTEQDQMIELFSQSRMQKLLIDGERPVSAISEQTYAFWIN